VIEWLKKALGSDPSRNLVADALAAHEAGDWVRAAALLQPLAAGRPGDAKVLYGLGNALYQLERAREALPLLEQAAAIDGTNAEYQYKLGNALKDLEQTDAALERYRRALQLEPRHAQALNNAGGILEQKDRTDEALDHYRRAIVADDKLQPAHSNLAMLLHRLDRFAEAVDAYQGLLRVDAHQSDVTWCNLGNAYLGLERTDDALRCYERALEFNPASGLAFYRLGIALLNVGRHQEAETAARRAVAIAPEHVEGWINLGDVLQAQDRLDEALAAYEKGRSLEPNRPDLLNNIGVVHDNRYSLETALQFFERAIDASPGYVLARMNLAGLLLKFGDAANAAAAYREILEIEPKHEQAARQLLLCLVYQPAKTDGLFAEHRAFGNRFASGKQPVPDWKPRTLPAGKLRIGYVSSDLRRHPIGYSLASIIKHHDRSAVEVYLYSHRKRPDDMTRWFQGESDAWRTITYLSDQAVVRMMREDRLDILVLLAGRCDQNRPLLAIQRPAPIQVSMHDPATSGLREMDYLIVDRSMVPRHTAEQFTERAACLPTFYVHPPLDPARLSATPPVAKNGWVTFGSFNNPAKINEDVVALWARILHHVPTSRLILKYFNAFSNPTARSRYLELFRKHGISEDRLSLSDQPADDRDDHLARYRQIDIALDPFPYNGTTTTFEALGMGVPVVTLEGERMVARMSVAMLNKIGLPQLIARNEAAYVEIAQELASNPERLTQLRSELPKRVARSPLCAEQARARQLERLFRRMWKISLARQTANTGTSPH